MRSSSPFPSSHSASITALEFESLMGKSKNLAVCVSVSEIFVVGQNASKRHHLISVGDALLELPGIDILIGMRMIWDRPHQCGPMPMLLLCDFFRGNIRSFGETVGFKNPDIGVSRGNVSNVGYGDNYISRGIVELRTGNRHVRSFGNVHSLFGGICSALGGVSSDKGSSSLSSCIFGHSCGLHNLLPSMNGQEAVLPKPSS